MQQITPVIMTETSFYGTAEVTQIPGIFDSTDLQCLKYREGAKLNWNGDLACRSRRRDDIHCRRTLIRHMQMRRNFFG
jgi:hypothetical protein